MLNTQWAKLADLWQKPCSDLQVSGAIAQATPYSPEAIEQAARGFKRATCKIDVWHPRQYGDLSLQARAALGQLWRLVSQAASGRRASTISSFGSYRNLTETGGL